MKKIFLLLAILAGAVALPAQTVFNTTVKDTTNIYYQAFKKCFPYHKIAKNNTLFVQEDTVTTAGIPETLNGHKIKIVSLSYLQKKIKRNKTITVISIMPMRTERGFYTVDIIPYDVSKLKKNIQFLYSGGYGVDFLYNCITQKFNFQKIWNGSI